MMGLKILVNIFVKKTLFFSAPHMTVHDLLISTTSNLQGELEQFMFKYDQYFITLRHIVGMVDTNANLIQQNVCEKNHYLLICFSFNSPVSNSISLKPEPCYVPAHEMALSGSLESLIPPANMLWHVLFSLQMSELHN